LRAGFSNVTLIFKLPIGMKEILSNGLRDSPRVALGVCGGIAAYKAAEILRGLQRAGCSVRVGMTKRACEFVQPLTFRALSGSHVVVDDYAPNNPDPIAHITFSQTIDLFLIAPATANIIAKFANGIADDFLTSTYLACTAPVLIAPAMNTSMWHHPTTQRNLAQLRADGVTILEPDEGEMACGTVGPGRLSDPEIVVRAALKLLNLNNASLRDLEGESFLITTGATQEAIDPVRFISNRSSGRMGFAIAEAAIARGATVTVVAGSTSVQPPNGVQVQRVTSAQEMYDQVMLLLNDATVFISAAAVADYKPTETASEKIKKNEQLMTLKLERTRDVLKAVGEQRRDSLIIIGFAAETENVIQNAEQKLLAKNLDAIVANDVTRPDSGFDSSNNAVTIITRDQAAVELPLLPKAEVAQRILDQVTRLRITKKTPSNPLIDSARV
jgi:phosphopantothenoylcysteine decarboxylase/phosphopantothenate--cysteine ligase